MTRINVSTPPCSWGVCADETRVSTRPILVIHDGRHTETRDLCGLHEAQAQRHYGKGYQFIRQEG